MIQVQHWHNRDIRRDGSEDHDLASTRSRDQRSRWSPFCTFSTVAVTSDAHSRTGRGPVLRLHCQCGVMVVRRPGRPAARPGPSRHGSRASRSLHRSRSLYCSVQGSRPEIRAGSALRLAAVTVTVAVPANNHYAVASSSRSSIWPPATTSYWFFAKLDLASSRYHH